METDPHPKGKRQEDALRTKEEQIEENNRDLISNISSSMTLNELFDHYVKMQTKRKKIKKRTSENYANSEDMVRRNYAKGCTKELGIYNNMWEALTIEQWEDFLELVEHSQESSWYYNLFVFLREDGQLLNAGRLDLLIYRIVYECNARKIANAIKTDAEPELLPNISTHILRHTACTRMAEKGMD